MRVYDLLTKRLDFSSYIEGLATSICMFENLEPKSEISSTDRLGSDFTYIALGMVNSTVVYKYDYRYKAMAHLATIPGHPAHVGGRFLSPRTADYGPKILETAAVVQGVPVPLPDGVPGDRGEQEAKHPEHPQLPACLVDHTLEQQILLTRTREDGHVSPAGDDRLDLLGLRARRHSCDHGADLGRCDGRQSRSRQ